MICCFIETINDWDDIELIFYLLFHCACTRSDIAKIIVLFLIFNMHQVLTSDIVGSVLSLSFALIPSVKVAILKQNTSKVLIIFYDFKQATNANNKNITLCIIHMIHQCQLSHLLVSFVHSDVFVEHFEKKCYMFEF